MTNVMCHHEGHVRCHRGGTAYLARLISEMRSVY